MSVKPIKVVHVIYDMSTAGAQTVVMNYLRSMKDDPLYELEVLLRDSYKGTEYEKELQQEGYKISYSGYIPTTKFRIIRPVINWIKCQIAMCRSIRSIHPDIVHTHIANILPFVCFPSLFSSIKIKVHTLHSDPYAISKAYSMWTRIALKVFGFFPVCVTEDQAEKVKTRYRIDSVKVIHNGLDIKTYTQWKGNADEVKERYLIPKGMFVIGYVGSLYSTKNVPFLINVFNEYVKINPKSVLLIVGDGVDRKNLEAKCKEKGIEDKVIFTGVQKDVCSLYHVMDVFVLPSRYESSSIVTLEAQLCGVRCVISDAVPKDVIISDSVNRLSLSDPIGMWVKAVNGDIRPDDVQNRPYDFSIEGSILQTKDLYMDLLRN